MKNSGKDLKGKPRPVARKACSNSAGRVAVNRTSRLGDVPMRARYRWPLIGLGSLVVLLVALHLALPCPTWCATT